jgi:hypothetical protein
LSENRYAVFDPMRQINCWCLLGSESHSEPYMQWSTVTTLAAIAGKRGDFAAMRI